ncbi:ThuA domain-containing protein [Naasia sp. SYSU D00948]|uniref:ThuA domain-containing protein n=1 Tax=Naasia sp. SYSU D00948 TaxID=2817379 RepID=UPI001B3042A7|nr:ThuA domain-containing protein [Naasia sp. SYSU D00948]
MPSSSEGTGSALLLSGGRGPFTDPWHPFAETSRRVEEILIEAGYEVEVSFDVGARMSDLTGVDLVVANAPEPADPLPEPVLEAARAALRTHLTRGGGVVGIHAAAVGLLRMPEWRSALGARWVPGRSMHPPLGTATVRVHPTDLTHGAGEFTVVDELYSHLGFETGAETLVSHELDDERHPLVWLRRYGSARAAGDALGHDARSFDSTAHAELLREVFAWAGGRQPTVSGTRDST